MVIKMDNSFVNNRNMNNNIIKLLLIQNAAIIADKLKNFENIDRLIENINDKNIDIIILPELFSIGWACDKFNNLYELEDNSESLDYLRKLAKKFKANVIGGSIIIKDKNSDTLKNTQYILNRNGDIITKYEKMHLYSYLGDSEGKYIQRGTNPVIATLDVCKVGLSICYDLRFPEIYRTYALNGADLLINTAAWPLSRENHWNSLAKARAIENQSFFVALSQTGVLENGKLNIGQSLALDPLGDEITKLNRDEQAIITEIDLSQMFSLRDEVKTLKDINKEGYILKN